MRMRHRSSQNLIPGVVPHAGPSVCPPVGSGRYVHRLPGIWWPAMWLVMSCGLWWAGRPSSALAADPADAVISLPVQKIVYKRIAGRELHLEVTRPSDWKPGDRRPAIVFFHGGGWVGGTPQQFARHAQYFAHRGVCCFQVEYRLLDREGTEPPAKCCADAVDAMIWIRSHARRLGIDPTRIAAAGGSAGGHLAAYLGSCIGEPPAPPDAPPSPVSARPDALLLFNPVYDNGPGGWGFKRVGARYKEFSPLHNISADVPPSIVFLGTEDKLIPVETAKRFRDTCLRAGVYSELHLFDGQPHGFFNYGRAGNRYFHRTLGLVDQFLARLGWLDVRPPSLEQGNSD
ncbi:MAG: hypothetical protein KatS3mg111_1273 [Pirellulaceae bacterium]|nr:MAG: hypothetical protein KatS3mg111_1273 [Pirellulaceae bacterium]